MENINKPHTPIKNWAEDEQPREKMLLNGADSLSKAELLAILINHGTRSRSAIELARDLLVLCDHNLHRLARFGVEDIQQVKGLGPAKAITIKAALELGIRKEADRLHFKKTILTTQRQVIDYLQPRLQDEDVEKVFAVLLNSGNRVLDVMYVSSGGLASAVADVRPVARKALQLGATRVILCHNHPSGSLKPSEADKAITRKFTEGLRTLDIELIDHIIISDEGFYSFHDG
jgi:DNA repair protein RadC